MIILCVKCHLSFIIISDMQLIICILQIKFDEPSGFYQLIQSLTNKGQYIMILYYNFIQHLIIDIKMKTTVSLKYKKY